MKKWTKFQAKAQKCSKVHFIREIWCSNREIGRFDEKLGDFRENRESWQVCPFQKKFPKFLLNKNKLINKLQFNVSKLILQLYLSNLLQRSLSFNSECITLQKHSLTHKMSVCELSTVHIL